MAAMATPVFQLGADDSNALRANGQISFANAGTALGALPALNGPLAIDLAGLLETDSAALAVLVAWAAKAHARGTQLRYLRAPSSLRNLAHLCDLDGLFADGVKA